MALQVSDITASSFTVLWPTATPWTSIAGYQVLIQPQGVDKGWNLGWEQYDSLATIGTGTMSYTFVGLKPNTNYKVIVRTRTKDAGDKDTEPIVVKTLDTPVCNTTTASGERYYTATPGLAESIRQKWKRTGKYALAVVSAAAACVLFGVFYGLDRSQGWSRASVVTLMLGLGLMALSIISLIKMSVTTSENAVGEIPTSGRPCLDPETSVVLV